MMSANKRKRTLLFTSSSCNLILTKNSNSRENRLFMVIFTKKILTDFDATLVDPIEGQIMQSVSHHGKINKTNLFLELFCEQ